MGRTQGKPFSESVKLRNRLKEVYTDWLDCNVTLLDAYAEETISCALNEMLPKHVEELKKLKYYDIWKNFMDKLEELHVNDVNFDVNKTLKSNTRLRARADNVPLESYDQKQARYAEYAKQKKLKKYAEYYSNQKKLKKPSMQELQSQFSQLENRVKALEDQGDAAGVEHTPAENNVTTQP